MFKFTKNNYYKMKCYQIQSKMPMNLLKWVNKH